MADYFNVKSSPYNAQGDGTTDDTSAIQAAIDAAYTQGGGRVFLPRGIYSTGHLTIKTNVLMFGEGMGVTIIKLRNAINDNIIGGTAATNVSVRDMTLDSNRTNQTGPSGAGINLVLCDFARVINVESKETYRNGLSFAGCQNLVVERCYVHDTGYIGIWNGSASSGTVGPNYGVVHACFVRDTGLDCIMVDGQIGLANFLVEGNYCLRGGRLYGATSCIYIENNSTNVKIIGNYCDTSSGWGVDTGQSTVFRGILIQGNVCVNQSFSGIQTHSPGISIVGNHCANNNQIVASAPTADYGGIYVDGNTASGNAVGCVVTSNVCTDTQTTKTQAYGVNLNASPQKVIVKDNSVTGNATSGIGGTGGTGSVVADNVS
jgi:hypothetical protein